jgi:hypothetical protein
MVVITNSTQQSPPWEANQLSGSQRISNIVETKSSYCAYNCPPHFPILCPKNTIHIIPSYLFRDQFNVILPSCLDLPNASFLKASHQNPLSIFVLLHMCHGAQIRKLLIMEFPQLLPISFLCCNNTELHDILPLENLGKIFDFNTLNYYILHTEHIKLYSQGWGFSYPLTVKRYC